MIAVNQPRHGELIGQLAGVDYNYRVDQCIARIRGGALLGGMIYKNYTGVCVETHFAGFVHDWINRDLLWAGFHYPFEQLQVNKLVGPMPSDNIHALEVAGRLGFTEEARISDVYPACDMIIVSMYRRDCRWLSLKPRDLLLTEA